MRTGPFCVPPTTAQVRGPAVDRSEVRAGRRRTTLALGVLAALAAVAAPTGSVDAGQASAPIAKLASCHRPADAVDLRNWSLTLPAPHSPVTVKQPQLATYSAEPFFAVRGCAIQFQTPVNSATTPNSRYPRSELREMADGGRRKAAWSSTAGRHELDAELAFTRLPAGKPHVVGAQVHDADDDIVTLRLEGSKLWITHRNHSHEVLVTDSYRLGPRLRLKFIVQHDEVGVYVNGRPVATVSDAVEGGYFKTGAYVQANCSNSSP